MPAFQRLRVHSIYRSFTALSLANWNANGRHAGTFLSRSMTTASMHASFHGIQLIGNPVLRTRCAELTPKYIAHNRTKELAQHMEHLMNQEDGMGIAAPQVGELLRMFIVKPEPSMPSKVCINPKILKLSDSNNFFWEGCLSVPSVYGVVPRADRVRVRYTTLQGMVVEEDMEDMEARVFLHEYDHLEGVMFTERLSHPAHLADASEVMKSRTLLGELLKSFPPISKNSKLKTNIGKYRFAK